MVVVVAVVMLQWIESRVGRAINVNCNTKLSYGRSSNVS
jgi:hypothetical protein